MMLGIILSVVSATDAKPSHITQFAEMSIQLRKEIYVGCVDAVGGIDIPPIFIVIISLRILYTAGDSERF